MTDAELKLWRELRLRQLGVKFRRQHPIGSFIVDFACLERRLCIEVDGAHHAERELPDAARTESIAARGFRILRFTDREVLMETREVVQVIWRAVQPPPPP